jgi:hypothetical protein
MSTQWAPLLGRSGVGEVEEVRMRSNVQQQENDAAATRKQPKVKKVQAPQPTFRQTTLLIDVVEMLVDNIP